MSETESFDLTPDEFARQVRNMFPFVRSTVGSQTFVGAGDPTDRYGRVRLVLLGPFPSDEDAPDPVPENAALAVVFEGLPNTWFAAIQARPVRGALFVTFFPEVPKATVVQTAFD